jgi:hypothetical protein
MKVERLLVKNITMIRLLDSGTRTECPSTCPCSVSTTRRFYVHDQTDIIVPTSHITQHISGLSLGHNGITDTTEQTQRTPMRCDATVKDVYTRMPTQNAQTFLDTTARPPYLTFWRLYPASSVCSSATRSGT